MGFQIAISATSSVIPIPSRRGWLHWSYLTECATIRVVGKKAKQSSESLAHREMAIEAAHFARKFGLTKDEALKMLKDARNLKPLANLTDRAKGH
jgi:uncharacterized protein YPO0396